jgi:hypothetical protein
LPLPKPVFCVFCNRGVCRAFCCTPKEFILKDCSGGRQVVVLNDETLQHEALRNGM